MYFWFGNALSIIISYLTRAAPGIAVGALVYTFLHLTVQPWIEARIVSISGMLTGDTSQLGELAVHAIQFLGLIPALNVVLSTISACVAIKIYAVSLKSFSFKA